MALVDFKREIETCNRCSLCKFIPMEKVKGYRHVNACPSIARYNFHAYSGGGRLQGALGILENRLGKELEIDDKFLEVVYNCQLCGACDVACKYSMDMEVLEPIIELRKHCVASGRTLPVLDRLITSLRQQATMVPGARSRRGDWAKDLEVKIITRNPAKVLFHAGCRVCYDREIWDTARDTVSLLQAAGVDVAVAGDKELCCGSRAYQMGYQADFLQQARQVADLIKQSGADTMVTGCADCYYAFKVLYDKFDMLGGLKVCHAVEYFDRLIKEGHLKPAKKVAARVTYHDPCHLGRLGEPYIHWQGKEIPGHIRIYDPPKEFRRGTFGVYQPPRDVLKSIPGLSLCEMDRIKEYAWCCGAGGGVAESNPEFALWTAGKRLEEAGSTGAEAIVTACPGCQQGLREAVKSTGSGLKVYDIVTLLKESVR